MGSGCSGEHPYRRGLVGGVGRLGFGGGAGDEGYGEGGGGMVGGIVGVGLEGVAEEAEAGGGLGVEEGCAEGHEAVVGDGDAAVERVALVLDVGDYGVDGDDGLSELVGGGQGVDEGVAADGDVAARAGLVPSVAVAAEEDGGSGGVVESVVLADYGAWG